MWMLQLSVMIALIWRMNLWNIIKTVTHPQSLGISFTINLLSKRRFALFSFSWRSLLSLIVNSVKIQFFFFCLLSATRQAWNISMGQWSYNRLCHCDKDMSRGFSDRDLLTWCWASILDQRVYWSPLNQSVLPSNCVWTFQPWTACLMAA